MASCKYCKHRIHRSEGYYCKKNHYYPNARVIRAMGCYDFKRDYEQLSLFDRSK